jgi:hypothetical protein
MSKILIYKEYNINYNFDYFGLTDTGDDDLICKQYKYFAVSRSDKRFEKYSKFRYDGCPMHSITLFGYCVGWGEFYNWIDREDLQFYKTICKTYTKEINE